jgi:UDP-N-acetylglucosamine 4,6-dehydratase/5-epimerase
MKDIFEGKVILITGGTGFLGRALTREILKFNPAAIRIFSRDEVKHHLFSEEFNHDPRLRNLIGDVRDYERLKKATKGCDMVIHAAALKRLDLLEYNVDESIKTNIIGTLNVVNACLENDVGKVLFISTDKACSPVNTYGACKFVSERIFVESNYSKGDKKTVFSVVRYGNVLESTGSVIPFFNMKIKNGDDIPLTDERMTRFIISPEGAVDLVFKAIRYGVGGEVFIPRLPAFRITDLIEILKEKNKSKNKVKIVGIRPGEKIHEIMVNDSEVPRTYEFMDLFVIASHLEEFKQNKNKPEYIKNNKPLNENNFSEYSSKDSVLAKNEVKKLLTELGLLG